MKSWSLTSLGRVIQQLGKRETHVGFRDSVLTTLLKPSLTGETITSLVICISADAEHMDETISSLRYGQLVSVVQNKAKSTLSLNMEVSKKRASDIRIELEKAERELMLINDQRPHISPRAVPSEARSFEKNMSVVKRLEKVLMACKNQNLEDGLPPDSGQAIVKKNELDVMLGIVERQKTIKGFWLDATPAYTIKERQVNNLKSMISSFTGFGI